MLAIRNIVDRYRLGLALRLNPSFRALYFARQNSLCQYSRLVGLRELAERIDREHVVGDIVECGVYRGGSALIIGERLLRSSPRKMWLFDVFTGMPKPGPEDPPDAWSDVGKFVSSPEVVQEIFRSAQLPLDNVRIISGPFEDTLPKFEKPRIAFLHIDCDWYESVKTCLEHLYDAVVPGGIVVFDDYGFWSGCKKAVDEFIYRARPSADLVPIDSESHYFVKKPFGPNQAPCE